MPLLNAKMHPAADEVVTVDPRLLVEEEVTVRKASTQLKNLKIANHYHGSLLSSVLFTLFSISQQQAIL